MATSKRKTKSNGINPVLIGAVGFGLGYALADYLAKQKLKDAVSKASTTPGTQSALQTATNIYQQVSKAGWVDGIKNIFK